MNYIKLGEIATITNGKRNAQDATENGKYPLFDRSTIVKRSDKYLYDKEAILVPGEGRTFIPKYYKGKFDLHQRCYAIFDLNHEYDVRFIYLYILWNQVYFQSVYTGSTVPSLRLGNFEKMPIPVYSLPEQQKIAAHLDSIQSAIENKKQQLQQLDELVKSKFVEMFGENNCKQVPFSEYAEIIDGDRGKNYPKSEEFFDDGYCLFLSAKNVTKNGFLFETNQFISEEKDKILRKGKLKRGDIVITTRGTIGNIAYFDETIPYENIRINSGMVIIRGKDLEFNQKFFLEAFRQKIDEIIATQVTGAAQPQLPIHIMSKITLPYPNIDLQNTFAEYVQKIDSAKAIIKTQLVDLQELLDSKMDEYFGE